MTTPSRQQLAHAQADLVRALVARGPIPPGFDARGIETAARSLVNKRRQAVARVWPKIVVHLGDAFVERFTAYAQAHPLPLSASPLGDGRAFLAWLQNQGPLSDELIIDALAFDLRYLETPVGLRARHGFLVKLARLNKGRILALRLPWWGESWWRLP